MGTTVFEIAPVLSKAAAAGGSVIPAAHSVKLLWRKVHVFAAVRLPALGRGSEERPTVYGEKNDGESFLIIRWSSTACRNVRTRNMRVGSCNVPAQASHCEGFSQCSVCLINCISRKVKKQYSTPRGHHQNKGCIVLKLSSSNIEVCKNLNAMFWGQKKIRNNGANAQRILVAVLDASIVCMRCLSDSFYLRCRHIHTVEFPF